MNKELTLIRIKSSRQNLSHQLNIISKQINDLDRLRELVKADDPEAEKHQMAYWAIVQGD